MGITFTYFYHANVLMFYFYTIPIDNKIVDIFNLFFFS